MAELRIPWPPSSHELTRWPGRWQSSTAVRAFRWAARGWFTAPISRSGAPPTPGRSRWRRPRRWSARPRGPRGPTRRPLEMVDVLWCFFTLFSIDVFEGAALWPMARLPLSFSPLSLSLSYVLPTWESLGRGGQLRKDAEVMANPMSENIGFLPSHMETRIVTFLHFVMFWLFCFCSNPILEFQGIISIVSGSPLVWLEPLEHSILSLQLPARYLFSLLDAMESNGLPADPYLTSLSAAVREKGSCPRGWRGRVS